MEHTGLLAHLKYSVIILLLVFGGCSYGYDVLTTVTPISESKYPANDGVHEVYFKDDNMALTTPYDQLAFIEVKGSPSSSTPELLKEMKKKAASIGADAIISIEHHYIVRQKGQVLNTLIDPKANPPEDYDTMSLTGIAIKYR